MDSSILRQLWSVIEKVQPQVLLEADEKEIAQEVIKAIKNQTMLTNEEIGKIHTYIHSRIPLIRDLAHARSI